MNALLSVERLNKAFGGLQAVYNLSFEVEPGEIVALIGPNGAGKTTVFHLIMGVHRPDRGRIVFQGKDITGWPTPRVIEVGIARAFQTPQFCPSQTVYENIELATYPNCLWARRSPSGERAHRVRQAAERVGLSDSDLERLPEMLPQAGLRRLEIARALATEPKLLLLDEPFAGLTTREVAALLQTIAELREEGLTIVLVDHNVRSVMELAERVLVLSFGQLIAQGPPEAVLQDPQVREAYLGAAEGL